MVKKETPGFVSVAPNFANNELNRVAKLVEPFVRSAKTTQEQMGQDYKLLEEWLQSQDFVRTIWLRLPNGDLIGWAAAEHGRHPFRLMYQVEDRQSSTTKPLRDMSLNDRLYAYRFLADLVELLPKAGAGSPPFVYNWGDAKP